MRNDDVLPIGMRFAEQEIFSYMALNGDRVRTLAKLFNKGDSMAVSLPISAVLSLNHIKLSMTSTSISLMRATEQVKLTVVPAWSVVSGVLMDTLGEGTTILV